MKKAMAIMLATALTFSATVAPVLADDAEVGTSRDNPIVLTYNDMDPDLYAGAWFDTGIGFEVYLPEEWVEVEVTEENAAAGLLYMAGQDGGGANFTMTYAQVPEGYTEDQLYEELKASMTSAYYCDLNDLPVILFENEESAVSGFSLVVDDMAYTAVMSAPSDDEYEEFSPVIANAIMSFSVILEDNATSSAESAAE